MRSERLCAIVPAAGKSTRMRENGNKQFIDIQGQSILERSIRVLQNCNLIDEIVVVTMAEFVEKVKIDIVKKNKFNKVSNVVIGGELRQDSVFIGYCAIKEKPTYVIVHDGARPFVSENDLIRCIEDAKVKGSSCLAVPVKDTVKVAIEGCETKTLDRNKLWLIQTPQIFRNDIFLMMHRKAKISGYIGEDDTVLAERAGCSVSIVSGSYYNIKITTDEDLIFAEAILKNQSNF